MKIVLLITVVESLAIASWLIFRRFRNEYSLVQPQESMIPDYADATATASIPAEVSHWNFINNWQVEDQSDDRRLTLGAVAAGAGSEPERRSFARRSHQRSFKTWSQARHD
jgi:hypothetical protein